MTKQTADRLKSHWTLVVMVTTIFLAGWMAREALSAEINTKVQNAEQRINERLSMMQEDVRDIRNFLIKGGAQNPAGPP